MKPIKSMERRTFIETFGILTKLEQMASIRQNFNPNLLIFENTQPYPGYYSKHDVDAEKPRTIFLAVKEKRSLQDILRLSFDAQAHFKNDRLDLTPCTISIFADSYNAIRVRHLRSFGRLADLCEWMKGEGISFMKYRQINETASLQIQKLFCLEEIVEGIYQDLDEPGERYVTLPKALTFGEFVKVTQAVKNNIDENNFDAALGLFFRKRGVADVVRIFEPFISIHNLEVIRLAYEQQIKRLALNEL